MSGSGKKAGWRMLFHGRGRDRLILAALNLAFSAWSTFAFLVLLRLDFVSWLAVNICAPVQIYTVIALLAGRRLPMSAAVLPLLWFGGGGLLLFGWSGAMVIGQISHLVMVATAAFILGESLRTHAFRELATGLGIGAVVVVILACFLLPWLQGSLSPAAAEILREMEFFAGSS